MCYVKYQNKNKIYHEGYYSLEKGVDILQNPDNKVHIFIGDTTIPKEEENE